MKCRFCQAELQHEFIDLVNSPPANSLLTAEQLNEPEVFFPLKIWVCQECFLVQIDEFKAHDDIFNDEYVYFSSYSTSWLAHAKAYVEMMVDRFGFNAESQVIEIASNDGYLLQYFKENGVPVLGVDPTANTAAVAIEKGIETIIDFWGSDFAQNQIANKGRSADLILGNNVLAHVPDIVDFVGGIKKALKPNGVVTMEFPHLMQLVEQNQFDTIYHEHFSYLSFATVKSIFAEAGLEMFDVQELPTHGGSLRVFAKHAGNSVHQVTSNVQDLIDKENNRGMNSLEYYTGYRQKADQVKYDLLGFLIAQKKAGKSVMAYGAAAKGNTLLNYCGVKPDLIDFVVDANPHKQNKFMPASHIPIKGKDAIAEAKPDFVLILPWNLKKEITEQLSYCREWGAQFVIPIPELEIL